MDSINLTVNLAAFLMIGIVFLNTLEERRILRELSDRFLPMLVADLLMLASNVLLWRSRMQGYLFAYRLFSSAACVCYYALLALFIRCGAAYTARKTPVSPWYTRLSDTICAVSAAGWVVSSFTDLFYSVNENGVGVPGKFYLLGQIGGYLVILMAVFLILRYYSVLGRGMALLFGSFALCPAAAVVVRQFWRGVDLMPAMMSLSLLLICSFLHVQQMADFHEQELQMEENRATAMLGKIHPQFLYSTLDAVRDLCRTDSELAQQTVAEFSDYLRGNLDSVESASLIPARKELEHARHYLNLEQLRQGNRLQTAFDAAADDFLLPPLTVQALAENAVNRCLRAAPAKYTISVRTEETETEYRVVIEDNGGFDSGAGADPDLRSLRRRLAEQCRGELDLLPSNTGTAAVIRIPRQILRKEHTDEYSCG